MSGSAWSYYWDYNQGEYKWEYNGSWDAQRWSQRPVTPTPRRSRSRSLPRRPITPSNGRPSSAAAKRQRAQKATGKTAKQSVETLSNKVRNLREEVQKLKDESLGRKIRDVEQSVQAVKSQVQELEAVSKALRDCNASTLSRMQMLEDAVGEIRGTVSGVFSTMGQAMAHQMINTAPSSSSRRRHGGSAKAEPVEK